MESDNTRDVAAAVRTPPLLDHLLERSSRTFALTIPLLPEPTRYAVTVAYLLFRVADTLEDATSWPRGRKLQELAALNDLIEQPSTARARELADAWLTEPPCDHEGYCELLQKLPDVIDAMSSLTPGTTAEIVRHTSRTISGMTSFVEREQQGRLQLDDIPDLKAYCYAVAGIVGEMLTELFLEDRGQLQPAAAELRRDAAAFGEALQLVNILKDSAADAEEGRCYLPPTVDRSAVFALAREDLDRAAGYCTRLESAEAPSGVVGFTALPVLLARATLARVEESGPGTKLTRPEVVSIIASLQQALDRRRVSELWQRG
ncbi:MAG: squalene/phytoene synthase family protein [bacterium]|nr:squalene/phytoene synthase family protein [bacterium]